MYEKDKTQRITLRVNEDQWAFIKANTIILGITPSEYLRIMINTLMSSIELDQCYEIINRKEGSCRENESTNIDDKL